MDDPRGTPPSRMGRDVLVSLLGGIVPSGIGVVGTVIAATRTDSAQTLTLLAAWTMVGYLSLSDLGLIRTAARFVAEGVSPIVVLRHLWKVSLGAGLVFGLAIGVLIGFRSGPPWALVLCLVPVFTSLQFPVTGALEASGRFGVLAFQRFLNAVFVYLIPPLVMMLNPSEGGTSIAIMMIVFYRMAAFVWLSACLPVRFQDLFGQQTSIGSTIQVGRVLTWIGISSVVGPLLLYADRGAVAALDLSPQLVVFYISLSEILIRTYVIPSTVLAVIFPWLARNLARRSNTVRKIVLIVTPTALCAALGGLALALALVPDGLVARVVPTVDPGIARTLTILLLTGTLMNWSSQLFIALLQVCDRQRAVALFQIFIAVPYSLVLLLTLVFGQGVLWVAGTWFARVAATWAGLWILSRYALIALRRPRN